MFYDSEEAVKDTAQEIEEALAGPGPHHVGPTTVLEFPAETNDESVTDNSVDAELLALIDEALAHSDHSEPLPNPFADLLVELEQEAAICEASGGADCDPFAELLAELESSMPQMPAVASEVEPTSEEVHALAEELAEETVAEAMQNVSEAAALPQDYDATSKLSLAKRALVQARDTLSSVIDLLNDEMLEQTGQEQAAGEILKRALHSVGAHIVEGVFDGERMVSGDGRMYSVPPNYASKSKLVEGDMLKLTVMPDGKMIYKQIGPTARDRVRGVLSCDERGGYCVLSDGARYKVIPASVSFFRGRPGDHVVALVPKGSPSKFAAVDFIVHQ